MKISGPPRITRLLVAGAIVVAAGALAVVQGVEANNSRPTIDGARLTELSETQQYKAEDPAELPVKTATKVDGSRERSSAPTEGETGALTAGATFVPVNPYRSFDSRAYTDGLLLWDEGIRFEVLTDVNGTPRIPPEAVAVTYNLTVTGTFGVKGFLAVYPADIAWPGNSSINWFAPELDLANGGVVALGNYNGPGEIAVYCGNVFETATDFIIDITGYYI
jgi:hypothetical protein